MAERVDTKLLEYSVFREKVIKLDNEEISFFEKEVWKLFVARMGWKILDEEKISGECMIQFFPLEKKKLIDKNFLMSPLFYIKYDSNQYIEIIDRSKEKVPKDLFFVILCR